MRLVLAVLTIFLFLFFFILTGREEYRHSFVPNFDICFVQQLENIPSTVNALIVGSSRIRYGVDSDNLSELLAGEKGRVFNVARNGDSPERNYAIIRDVLANGSDVDSIVMDVKLSDFYHVEPLQKWRNIGMGSAQHSDLLLYRNAFPDKIGIAGTLIVQSIETKIAHGLRLLLNGTFFSIYTEKSTSPLVDCLSEKHNIEPAELEKFSNTFSIESVDPKYQRYYSTAGHKNPIVNPRAQLTLFFVDEVRKLCDEYGVKLIITSPPMFKEPKMSDQALEQIQSIIPEFRRIRQADFVESDYGYRDDRHMAGPLRSDYTLWIAQQLIGNE